MAPVRLGRFVDAERGVQAAAPLNADAPVLAIAAFPLALSDRLAEARAFLPARRKMQPRHRIDNLLTAMQFAPDGGNLFRKGARRLGRE